MNAKTKSITSAQLTARKAAKSEIEKFADTLPVAAKAPKAPKAEKAPSTNLTLKMINRTANAKFADNALVLNGLNHRIWFTKAGVEVLECTQKNLNQLKLDEWMSEFSKVAAQ